MDDLLNRFIQFEEENEMFGITLNGVKLWHYMRNAVFYSLDELLTDFKVLSKIEPYSQNHKVTFQDKLRAKTVCNQFLVSQRDILIIPHERKYIDHGHYGRCIYTDLIDKNLHQSHYILASKSVMDCYIPQKSKNIIYCDIEAYRKIKRIKDDNTAITVQEFDSKIVFPVETFFNIKLDSKTKREWKRRAEFLYSYRAIRIAYYEYMLRRIKPKLILEVVGYGTDRMALCEAAKEKGIPVVELAHAWTNTIPYMFYSKANLKCFPDYIFKFGKGDNMNDKYPIDDNRVIPVGFPELESYVKNSYRKKHKKVILMVSEGSNEISEFTYELAKKIGSEYQIIYKLHPKEYGNFEKIVGKFLSEPRIKVMGDFNRTIYSYLSIAEWVIGGYSAALMEATAFNTKIAVIKMKKGPYSIQLVDSGRAVLVNDVDNLLEKMKDENVPSKGTDQFFERNSLDNIQRNIDRIIKQHNRV